MKTTKRYSCIIPVYNEAARVVGVLKAVTRVPELSQIICVDDGSSDGSFELIRRKFPSVTLIRHEKNRGKAEAIKSGLARASEEYIFLVDSDLTGLKPKEVTRAIRTFEANTLDCLLLCARARNIWDTLCRITIRLPHCFTGNRIMRKHDVETILRAPNVRGYSFEFPQNNYFMDNKKSVAYVNISAKNVFKVQKVGLVRGIAEEINMWSQALRFVGFGSVLRQALLFARRRIR